MDLSLKCALFCQFTFLPCVQLHKRTSLVAVVVWRRFQMLLPSIPSNNDDWAFTHDPLLVADAFPLPLLLSLPATPCKLFLCLVSLNTLRVRKERKIGCYVLPTVALVFLFRNQSVTGWMNLTSCTPIRFFFFFGPLQKNERNEDLLEGLFVVPEVSSSCSVEKHSVHSRDPCLL